MQIQINIPKDQLEAAVSEAIRKQAPASYDAQVEL